jgi:ankyrin repeat protein
LSKATAGGHTEIIQALLNKGAAVNVKGEEGVTALIYAVEKGDTDRVCDLLAKGVDPNATDADGNTVLNKATAGGHTEIIQALLNKGAAVNAKDKEGVTALFYAVEKGDANMLCNLLNQGTDPNATDADGNTVLKKATAAGHTEIIQALLNKGAAVDAVDKDGQTALMEGVKNRHLGTVQVLLAHDADIKIKDKNGATAMILATKQKHTEIVQLLQNKIGDDEKKDTKDEKGAKATPSAADVTSARSLPKKDVAANAVTNSNAATVQDSPASGTNVKIKDNKGMTASQGATSNKHTEKVESLKQSKSKSPQVPKQSLQENRKNLHILLTEDNAFNQRLAVRTLKKRGHIVVVAKNGKEAVSAVEKKSFDLVLMDIQMPEMDGFEATKFIRKKEKITGRHIPVIAMSANTIRGNSEKYSEAGMDGYVSKPIKAEELFKVIEQPQIKRQKTASST